MPIAVIAMQWENYAGGGSEPGIFRRTPLSFNSDQARFDQLCPGDRLWLVARSPSDHQYYFVGVLTIDAARLNAPASVEAVKFGRFAVLARPAESIDLGTVFAAEGLLRALQFESGQPIKYGASIGQSLQTLRLLRPTDDLLLSRALNRIDAGERPFVDHPFGLWTKCNRVFADYFVNNWRARRRPMAFMLYDPPPAVPPSAPVFIHSDKVLRLVGRFGGSRFVAGHKFTAAASERVAAREWFWTKYRDGTIDAPAKADFDGFWDAQHGVRAYFLLDEITEITDPPQFKEYGRALEWGYPTGVGYRYLALSQVAVLLKAAKLSDADTGRLLAPLLTQAGR